MRIWQDSLGNLITDEQLLRYVAHFGSLSAALGEGDIRLFSAGDTGESKEPATEPHQSTEGRRAHAKLSARL